jgi:Protein of unknown function (DUF3485)
MGILRIAAAALIVGAGLIHGKWTNRWAPTPALAALAARFDSVPMTIGDWTATPFRLGERERKLAGAEACLARVYTNAARGLSVSVLLLGGLPGDIAAHTPEVCYPGAGYQLAATRWFDYRPVTDGPRAGFQTAVATRGGSDPSALRIFWAWHSSTGWVAPEAARWKFASEPTLCKLYVIRETGGSAIDPDLDPCNEFLGVFLPELDRAVFPAADERAARGRLQSGGPADLPDAGRPRTPQG